MGLLQELHIRVKYKHRPEYVLHADWREDWCHFLRRAASIIDAQFVDQQQVKKQTSKTFSAVLSTLSPINQDELCYPEI